MRSISFKFKLLLAMMLVVCGITGATMYVAQGKLESMQEQLFQREFESEVALFSQAQDARLGAVQEKCRTLAGSVRLIAAMQTIEDEISEETLEPLYKIARDEFGLRGAMRREASFFRFITRDGKVLPNPAVPNEKNEALAARLSHAKTALASNSQAVGYLAFAEDDGSDTLHEILLTKIVDPAEDRLLGALLIGFPFVEHEHRSGQNDLDNGIILQGSLYSMGITGPARQELVQGVSEAQGAMAHRMLKLNGVPHSVYYRPLNAGSHWPPAWHVAVHSMASAIDDRNELRGTVLALGATAMAIALLLSLVLSHGLTGPVHELVRGTKAIREGDYTVSVPVRNHDEIGELAESFNEMVVGLALKEKYRSVLDIVADKGIAEELMNGKIELGGEERTVSVLFCDIRGFTALTERMQPPEVIRMLNEHFTPLTRVVYEHHGVVDKFVGDLIMAIFGAPKSTGNDAQNAVNCALAMIRERTELNLRSEYKIRIGIGIATGKAVAGRMGSNDRMNYTVLGPKVNLASRLCGQAAPMDVVVDCETLNELSASEGLEREPMPEMKLKGFAEIIKAWKVRAKNSA
jgi:class 3 adenylate cyclase/HAMP domain-containing protein